MRMDNRPGASPNMYAKHTAQGGEHKTQNTALNISPLPSVYIVLLSLGAY